MARCGLGSRLWCCLVNACDTCAKKTVAETSKCWTCGGIAYLDHVSKDDELRKRVLEWRNDLSTGRPLKCSLCGEVPMRVVNAPCCWAPACRNCAVKKLTTSRVCWREGCKTNESLTTDQLVNDQDFREAVEFFNSNGRLEEEQARQILLKLWRMDPVRRKREADITCSICQDICKRGVKTPCCNAVACRSCATREMTSTRACYGCKKSGITTVMLKNDPSLRAKVERYKWNPLSQRRQFCTPKPSFVPRLAGTGPERVRTTTGNRFVFNKMGFISLKPQNE